MKPQDPLNNKRNEFLWTSWGKKFRSLQNYVSKGLEWAFPSLSKLPLLIYKFTSIIKALVNFIGILDLQTKVE